MKTPGEQVYQEWFDAWNAHDVEGAVASLTEDAIYEDVPTGTVNRSHEDARAFLKSSFDAFPDLRFELTSLDIADKRGTAEWTMMGTHQGDFPGLPATGKAFSVRGVSLLEFSDDRIGAVRDYYDFATILRDLGIIEEPS